MLGQTQSTIYKSGRPRHGELCLSLTAPVQQDEEAAGSLDFQSNDAYETPSPFKKAQVTLYLVWRAVHRPSRGTVTQGWGSNLIQPSKSPPSARTCLPSAPNLAQAMPP